MKVTGIVVASVLFLAGAHDVRAQNPAAEKTIVTYERAVNEAIAKGTVAGFSAHVATDGWMIDPTMGRAPVADMVRDFSEMAKAMKITSWDITDSKVQWVDATTAVHTYKWTGKGTYQGQPLPSPVWASTVWADKNGKWTAVFHQETLAPAAPGKH